jgi:hypothetical protein
LCDGVFDFVNNKTLVLVFWKLKNQKKCPFWFSGEVRGVEESRIETCAVPCGYFKNSKNKIGGFHERTSKELWAALWSLSDQIKDYPP